MRFLPAVVGVVCALTRGCAAPPSAQQPVSPQLPNPAISAALTCGKIVSMLHSPDKKSGGLAILWLDGYYSGRANLPALSAGWSQTVSQGVGGTCAISVNASRAVLDVIAQLHREYGGR